MLKKAGIVAAGVTAGLLVLSPLAFASEGHGHHGHHDRGTTVIKDNEFKVDDSYHRDQTNRCEFEQNTLGKSLLGALTLTPVQAPVGNCTNVHADVLSPPPVLPPPAVTPPAA